MSLNNHLHIIAAYKNHVTFLKHCYYKQPFKLKNITEDKRENLLRLMIASSSPGILNNDNYQIKIEIEENAKVYLTTQSYQRLFNMANNASQKINVYIEDHGTLFFLPHPTVPHEASSFSCTNNIYLKTKHNLIWSEIITCGRKLSGEEFKFTRFQNTTNVYLNNKLVVKENILLEPLQRKVHTLGQLEGYTHQSTLLFINDDADLQSLSGKCQELLSGVEGCIFGISTLPVRGLIFRILAQKGEKLFDCNNGLALLIGESLRQEKELHS